jgi:hypothetical protein
MVLNRRNYCIIFFFYDFIPLEKKHQMIKSAKKTNQKPDKRIDYSIKLNR